MNNSNKVYNEIILELKSRQESDVCQAKKYSQLLEKLHSTIGEREKVIDDLLRWGNDLQAEQLNIIWKIIK